MVLLLALNASAQTLFLDGDVPAGGPDHFFVPFEVPAGTVEIEVRHEDLGPDGLPSDTNILDWGLDDPLGWRGWGGGNAEPAIVGLDAASRSYVPGPIPTGTWNVVIGKAKVVDLPASWRVEIDLRTAPTLPPQLERTPYVPSPPLSTEARWYAGDLHVHSSESGDASASLDAIADRARLAGLDFVVVTDHNTITHLDFLVDAQSRHPDVLLIPGTEFTTYGGHANAIGVSAWVDHKIGLPGVTIEDAADAYVQQGALFSINHPALDLGDLCIGCAWTHDVPADAVAGVEIATGGWDATGVLFTPLAIDFWDELTRLGYAQIAPIGGSDDHRAGTDTGPFASPIGSPTTLVFATELSVEAILAGIESGRTVVQLQDSDDPMAEIGFDGETVTVRVTGGAGDDLVWVANGEEIERIALATDDETWTRPLTQGWLRAEVWVDGAPRTITANEWFRFGDMGGRPPLGCWESSCGCHSTPTNVPLGVLIGLLIGRVRRRTH